MIPYQSPTAGIVVTPSPLVSPAAKSSLKLVKTTAPSVVPAAIRPPATEKLALGRTLTTTPACTVRVTPAAMLKLVSMT